MFEEILLSCPMDELVIIKPFATERGTFIFTISVSTLLRIFGNFLSNYSSEHLNPGILLLPQGSN